MRHATVLCLLLALPATSAWAQDPGTRIAPPAEREVAAPSPAQVKALERVAHWAGEWSGSGWSMRPDRQRELFDIEETVSLRLGGSVLLVEGRGTSTTGDVPGDTSHESLAVLSFDTGAARYNWRTYDLRGHVRDPEFVVDDDAFRWGFRDEDAGVLLRFTIVIQGDTWHEVGEVSPDEGENWYQILEMNLTRK